MGHGQSKPEPWIELRPGMRPIRRKIDEVKRRRRERKLSIVSTSELLRPEEREEMVEDESTGSAAGTEAGKEGDVVGTETVGTAATAAEKVKEEKTIDNEEKEAKEVKAKETAAATTAVPENNEEKKRGLGFKGEEEEEEDEDDDDEKKGRKFGSSAADEERPGSPSFRFYCTDLARDLDDDPSLKFGGHGTRDKLPEIMEKEKNAHGRDSSIESVNSSEDLEIKPLKKDKGRRLKALTKAPGHVYNFLNVRNCYSNSSSASSRDSEGLLDGKASL